MLHVLFPIEITTDNNLEFVLSNNLIINSLKCKQYIIPNIETTTGENIPSSNFNVLRENV